MDAITFKADMHSVLFLSSFSVLSLIFTIYSSLALLLLYFTLSVTYVETHFQGR